MKVTDKLIGELNLLLARSRDAQKGYIETANEVAHPDLKSWMLEYSGQRMAFATELEHEIRHLGGKPDNDTSLLGELHRAWIELIGKFSGTDTNDILEECLRGEKKAYENYQEVISNFSNMPTSTYSILADQQSKIKGAIAQLETMIRVLEPVEN